MAENLSEIDNLTETSLGGETYRVEHVSTDSVPDTNGVVCAVYKVVGHENIDLGACYVPKGISTPWQFVQKGERTIEKPFGGNGVLRIVRANGDFESYFVKEGKFISSKKSKAHHSSDSYSVEENIELEAVEVYRGDTMRWTAEVDSVMIVHEFCENPAWDNDRFETVPSNLSNP